MRSWVEKLRWGLLAGGLALLLLLVGVLGYSRYQAIRAWHRILQRTGAALTRETNGFTYSQSVGGHTVFTLHAAKAVQGKDGKYALHDVALLLYRQADGRPDRIYGSEFEYDQKTGVARALGAVHMDMQAPRAIGGGKAGSPGRAEPADAATDDPRDAEHDLESDPETIHIKTSGLVYVRNLGVAATDQDVEFRYGQLECHAHGAEFNSGQSAVHLLADVQVNGEVHGRELNLIAQRADLDRQTNVVLLKHPEVRTADQTASALDAVLHLRPDGSVAGGEANGSVRVVRGTQVLTAERVESRLAEGPVLQQLHLTGGVKVVDADPTRPVQAHAAIVDAAFGPHGEARSFLAEGGAWLEFYDRAHEGTGLRRDVSGDRIDAIFATAGAKLKPVLKVIKVHGKARASAESYRRQEAFPLPKAGPGAVLKKTAFGFKDDAPETGGPKSGLAALAASGVSKEETMIEADDLVVTLEPGPKGKAQPRVIEGTGRTALEQRVPGKTERRTTGDRLTLRMGHAGSAVDVESAVQEGHVALRTVTFANAVSAVRESVSSGTAQRVEYKADIHRFELTGQVHLNSDSGELRAAEVSVDTQSGALDARGEVLATLTHAGNGEPPRNGTPAAPAGRPDNLHVTAMSARFLRETGTAEFHGTEAQPARLWQGGSQVEAATLFVDQKGNTLAARPVAPNGVVRCVLVSGGSVNGTVKTGERRKGAEPLTNDLSGVSGNVLRVSSARLDYAGTAHEATFTGGVRMTGGLGEAHSQSAVIFLKGDNATAIGPGMSADLLGGSVDKVVLSGKVQLEQPGRLGTGEQLLYTAADASLVLTGSAGRPPHIVDAQQGSLTGATLLFRTGDNTVVVAGDPARPGGGHGRVRTELNLRP